MKDIFMYLPYPLLSKIGRYVPEKPVRMPEFPAVPGSPVQASPCRPAALGTVGRGACRRAGQRGVVPRGLLCAAAMALPTFGCGLLSPEAEDTALVTDGTGFQLERVGGGGGRAHYRVEIPYSFTDRTGTKVYVPNCGGEIDVRLEVKKAGAWAHYWPLDIVVCVHDPPIVIEPDEVYRTTLTIGYTSGEIRELPTRYRIKWGLVLSSYDEDTYPFGEEIPLEERVSNSFTVRASY